MFSWGAQQLPLVPGVCIYWCSLSGGAVQSLVLPALGRPSLVHEFTFPSTDTGANLVGRFYAMQFAMGLRPKRDVKGQRVIDTVFLVQIPSRS